MGQGMGTQKICLCWEPGLNAINYSPCYSLCLLSVSSSLSLSLSLILSLSPFLDFSPSLDLFLSLSLSLFITVLPRLLTPPQIKDITTSTIEIEWKGDHDGDGPVCGFIVELKPSASTSWKNVGFVSFDEDQDDFEYTIERLDADALYGISVRILHCSGRGKRGPEISQSTEDYGQFWV